MPIDNRPLTDLLFSIKKIRAQRSAWFDHVPTAGPISRDRVIGLMLGLAIGDALGNSSEGKMTATRRARHGEIRDYLKWDGDGAVGLPSDDTQMAAWTLECLLDDDGLLPPHVADVFATRHIYGIGQSVHKFVLNHRNNMAWHECGPESAGNGALMRIAPVVLPWLSNPSPALWADALLCATITHNDAFSNSACVAFTHILWELLHAERAPDPAWWLDQWMRVAPGIEGDDTDYKPRNPSLQHLSGPAWRTVEMLVRAGLNDGFDVERTANSWYSGAYLLETVPCVLYILARHGHDPEEAIVRAVNDTRDNDTVAAIVGAAMGALHGASALPERWRRGLLGRTRGADDGRVQALIGEAADRWL